MLNVSSSPHIRDKVTTQKIMLDVIIALMPMLIASTLIFGIKALVQYFCSVLFAVLCEYLSCVAMKKEQTCQDLSAVVTGLLLAASLPVDFPLWMLFIGDFVAIVVVKQCFGGLGSNFANPAVTARIFLLLSFTAASTNFKVLPKFAVTSGSADLVTSATPLALAKEASADAAAAVPNYMSLFLGKHAGSIGEVCILALLIGGLYLVVRKVIDLYIPLTFMASFSLMIFISGNDPLWHILSGGVVIAAFFMATDYVTSPTTVYGKIIFGVGLGVFTFIIRMYSSMPEGVSYAILLMNILTPHINRYTAHKTVGARV